MAEELEALEAAWEALEPDIGLALDEALWSQTQRDYTRHGTRPQPSADWDVVWEGKGY